MRTPIIPSHAVNQGTTPKRGGVTDLSAAGPSAAPGNAQENVALGILGIGVVNSSVTLQPGASVVLDLGPSGSANVTPAQGQAGKVTASELHASIQEAVTRRERELPGGAKEFLRLGTEYGSVSDPEADAFKRALTGALGMKPDPTAFSLEYDQGSGSAIQDSKVTLVMNHFGDGLSLDLRSGEVTGQGQYAGMTAEAIATSSGQKAPTKFEVSGVPPELQTGSTASTYKGMRASDARVLIRDLSAEPHKAADEFLDFKANFEHLAKQAGADATKQIDGKTINLRAAYTSAAERAESLATVAESQGHIPFHFMEPILVANDLFVRSMADAMRGGANRIS